MFLAFPSIALGAYFKPLISGLIWPHSGFSIAVIVLHRGGAVGFKAQSGSNYAEAGAEPFVCKNWEARQNQALAYSEHSLIARFEAVRQQKMLISKVCDGRCRDLSG